MPESHYSYTLILAQAFNSEVTPGFLWKKDDVADVLKNC